MFLKRSIFCKLPVEGICGLGMFYKSMSNLSHVYAL